MPRISRPSLPPVGRPAVGPARFESVGKLKVSIQEGSDVVALPGNRFLVAGDTSNKLALVGADGKTTRLELPGLPGKHSQLEGVAYDPARQHLFVAREESRELLRYQWSPDGGAPKLEQRFELPLGGARNKGVEGLAFLSGEVSPTGRPQLLLAKEGQPRQLMLLGEKGGGTLLDVKLEEEVKRACRDFSAVAVDPWTGHVFISSDESCTVAEVKLERRGDKLVGKLVGAFPVRNSEGKPLERIEGLTFNARGDLLVLTENDSALHRLARR